MCQLFKCLVELMKRASPGLLFVGCFLIADSISALVICHIFYFFLIQSWRCHFSRNLSISSRFSILLAFHCLWYYLRSFVFLWCQLYFLLFHFWFYLFGPSLFLSCWVWFNICQFVYLFKEQVHSSLFYSARV